MKATVKNPRGSVENCPLRKVSRVLTLCKPLDAKPRGLRPLGFAALVGLQKIPWEPWHCPAPQCRNPRNFPDGTCFFSTLPQGCSTVPQSIKIMIFLQAVWLYLPADWLNLLGYADIKLANKASPLVNEASPLTDKASPHVPLVNCEDPHIPLWGLTHTLILKRENYSSKSVDKLLAFSGYMWLIKFHTATDWLW